MPIAAAINTNIHMTIVTMVTTASQPRGIMMTKISEPRRNPVHMSGADAVIRVIVRQEPPRGYPAFHAESGRNLTLTYTVHSPVLTRIRGKQKRQLATQPRATAGNPSADARQLA